MIADMVILLTPETVLFFWEELLDWQMILRKDGPAPFLQSPALGLGSGLMVSRCFGTVAEPELLDCLAFPHHRAGFP